MLNCLFAMLWIRPIDISFQLEGGYFYFNQLFDLDSNNCINGIDNVGNNVPNNRVSQRFSGHSPRRISE